MKGEDGEAKDSVGLDQTAKLGLNESKDCIQEARNLIDCAISRPSGESCASFVDALRSCTSKQVCLSVGIVVCV